MKYPCGTNYCGCNMTKISNCEDCYYKSTHQDMGASWNVCTLHKDLSSATIACEHSDNCKSKITYKEVNQAIEKQILGKSNQDKPIIKTNYDRIRNMSVEEMAVNLLGGKTFCPYFIVTKMSSCNKNCLTCIKKWLENEVEE